MSVLVVGLLTAILGAVVGALISNWLTRDYKRLAADATAQLVAIRDRVEALENKRSQREAWDRFRPSALIVGELPSGQHLRLEADSEFSVTRMDYLEESGAMVDCDDVNLTGKQILVPIDNKKVVRINNMKSRQISGSFPIAFRCHLRVNDDEKTHVVEAVVQPDFKMIGNTQTYLLKVVGGA
jgi:hypothetical protein